MGDSINNNTKQTVPALLVYDDLMDCGFGWDIKMDKLILGNELRGI
jgi:hypothetical protein